MIDPPKADSVCRVYIMPIAYAVLPAPGLDRTKAAQPGRPGPPQLRTSSRGGTPPPFDSATLVTLVTVATVMLRGDDIWGPAVGGVCHVAVLAGSHTAGAAPCALTICGCW